MSKLKIPVGPEDHLAGNPNAPVTLVEYGDYECPHCGAAHPIVQQLRQDFGDNLAFVFRNFPLREIHPNAEPAAESAEFAATANRFWEMHDAIFENQDRLEPALLLELAAELGLEAKSLAAALDDQTYAPKVKHDFTGGVRSGVNGTPTFFINGTRHDAPPTYEDLTAALNAALI